MTIPITVCYFIFVSDTSEKFSNSGRSTIIGYVRNSMLQSIFEICILYSYIIGNIYCSDSNIFIIYVIPYNPTSTYKYLHAIKQNTKSCTYVGLYRSGLFNFVSHLTLFGCFLGFDIPTSSFIFIGNVFCIYICIIIYVTFVL